MLPVCSVHAQCSIILTASPETCNTCCRHKTVSPSETETMIATKIYRSFMAETKGRILREVQNEANQNSTWLLPRSSHAGYVNRLAILNVYYKNCCVRETTPDKT